MIRVRALPLVLLAGAALARAEGDPPFDAETARLLEPGQVRLEAALDLAGGTHRVLFPGETAGALVLPRLGLRSGLGSWGEIRVVGDAFVRFDPEGEDPVQGPGDWWVRTKVRLGSPDRVVRWAAQVDVKIPVAADDEGLGTDLVDVGLLAIATIDAGRGRFDLNAGVDLLGAPFRERSQQDLLRWAAAYWWSPGQEWQLGGEAAGRTRGDFFPAEAMLRVGTRFRRRAWGFDGALGAGLTGGSPDWEIRAGVTWSFRRGPRTGAPSR